MFAVLVVAVVALTIDSNKKITDNYSNINQQSFEIIAGSTYADGVIDDIYQGRDVRQSFKANSSGVIDTISVKLATYANSNLTCELHVQLIFGTSIPAEIIKDCKEIGDNQQFVIKLEQPIAVHQGDEITVHISATGDEENKIAIYKDSTYDTTYFVNGEESNGGLTLIVARKRDKPLPVLSWVEIYLVPLLLLLALGLGWHLFRNRVYLLVIYSIFTLGIIHIINIPAFINLDEHERFARAVEISYGSINSGRHNSALTAAPEYRDVLLNTLFADHALNGGYASEFKNVSKIKARSDRSGVLTTTAGGDFPLLYIFAAPLITVARIAGVPIIYQLYLARIAMLLLFISLILIATYLNKRNRMLWLSLSFLPTIITQASAISLDSVVNACMIVFIALLLRTQNLSKLSFFLVNAVALVLSVAKFVYFPLAASMLLITCLKYFKSWKKATLVAVLISLMLLLLSVGWLAHIGFQEMKADVRMSGTNPRGQLSFVLEDPVVFLNLIFNSIVSNRHYYASESTFSIFNNARKGMTPDARFYVYIYVVVIILVAASQKIKLNKIHYLLMTIALAGSTVLLFYAMYSGIAAVGATSLQVPGRYMAYFWLIFLPLLTIPNTILSKYLDVKNFKYFSSVLYLSTLSILIGSVLIFLPYQ